MKRIVSLIIICIIITATAQIGVSAASANFTVEDGVLLSYSGDAANITIPTEVYRIESGVFEDNTSIKSVTIPSSVTEIGDKAFYNCSSLSEVAGGENVYSVGAFCFDKTPYLTQSHDEFFTLGKALLWYNGTASQVTLPDGIWSIAPYAFLRCQTIRSFSASDDLSMIGEGAFFECTHLSLVSIPNSVKFIDAYAFTGTSYQAQAGEFVVLGDGILTAYNGGDDEIMIPDSVRLIAPRTFYEYTALSKVKIPSSVYAIGKQAFCQCTSLSDLSLSSGLVHIGEEAFVNCKKLKTLSLPSSVSLVDKGAFLNCTGLEELSLCGKELSVSYGAFAYCTSLKLVLMSSDVSSIYDKAFYKCQSLKAISVSDATVRIPSSAFEECPVFTLSASDKSFAASSLSRVANLDAVKGDSDRDRHLTVLDATVIQKYMASLVDLSFEAKAASDTDYDGYLTILDATRIQKILAHIV
ncbi:MAG: leucine-rich repeat protein [Ruminococcus sp.]|nr:leucine-rich repeat protein [Ruminococcus sp.]